MRESCGGEQAPALAALLASVDDDGSRRKALAAPGTLVLRAVAVRCAIALERYEQDPATGRRVAKPVGPLTAGVAATLPPGSYRLVLAGPAWRDVVYAFELAAASSVEVDLHCRRASVVPEASCTCRRATSGSATPTSSCAPSFWTRCPSIGATRTRS